MQCWVSCWLLTDILKYDYIFNVPLVLVSLLFCTIVISDQILGGLVAVGQCHSNQLRVGMVGKQFSPGPVSDLGETSSFEKLASPNPIAHPKAGSKSGPSTYLQSCTVSLVSWFPAAHNSVQGLSVTWERLASTGCCLSSRYPPIQYRCTVWHHPRLAQWWPDEQQISGLAGQAEQPSGCTCHWEQGQIYQPQG